ncbi:MAG: hypothetical protein K9G76_01800 [Bacteroidales bacterium]|nr:hypothetical protein [Bacteroidales bacterium]MCF8403288.1 hypothetical protein [Bacteroidales bacterium]
MKTIRYLLVGFLLSMFYYGFGNNPDEWSGEPKQVFWHNWIVGLDAGLTSYFGDLSQFDTQIAGKLNEESRPALSLKLTKPINPKFEISIQVLYGGVQSDYIPSRAFVTSFFELNLQGNLNILNTLKPNTSFPLSLNIYAGAGRIFLAENYHKYMEGSLTGNSKSSKTANMVFLIGGNCQVPVSPKVKISLDLSMRQVQNDMIDNFEKNNNLDYYTYVSLGVNYAINNLICPFKKEKKYRAHEGLRLTRHR